MEKSKLSPQEIYELLDEQKRLMEIKDKLAGMLEKVNHNINSLAVENLQLTQSMEISSDNEEQEVKKQPPEVTSPVNSPPTYNQVEQSEIINQQMIVIDLKQRFDEEIESDDEIDFLERQ